MVSSKGRYMTSKYIEKKQYLQLPILVLFVIICVVSFVSCSEQKESDEEHEYEIGRIMFHDSVEQFKAAGKSKMIIWCFKENYEARKFYEKMDGLEYKYGTHKWGDRDYDMISYTYNLNELE